MVQTETPNGLQSQSNVGGGAGGKSARIRIASNRGGVVYGAGSGRGLRIPCGICLAGRMAFGSGPAARRPGFLYCGRRDEKRRAKPGRPRSMITPRGRFPRSNGCFGQRIERSWPQLATERGPIARRPLIFCNLQSNPGASTTALDLCNAVRGGIGNQSVGVARPLGEALGCAAGL